MSDPHEVAAVATVAFNEADAGPACDAQVPLSAVQSLGKDDAFIWIVEWDTSGRFPSYASARSSPPRPDHFNIDSMTILECGASVPSDPGLTFRSVAFSDAGREFLAFVVLGASAGDRRDQVVSILDSLQPR